MNPALPPIGEVVAKASERVTDASQPMEAMQPAQTWREHAELDESVTAIVPFTSTPRVVVGRRHATPRRRRRGGPGVGRAGRTCRGVRPTHRPTVYQVCSGQISTGSVPVMNDSVIVLGQ